ncbi:Interferon-induced protein with tetratricopeptide repeats 5 [Holothuria leucospilota]|uniref:Interferon-induced protein with tetratricopeptide repeats 5 n=1 Tax=Holothuria leucospilota TaxID=206669 RepID=A0A9Q1C218_HOLLE|nr:Interferon-induced protein with tetratricopeptide repeats 5 [Holothuria leucospilota]
MVDESPAWKDIPCHFTWGISDETTELYETKKRFLQQNADKYDGDVNTCPMLLFLGFLEYKTSGSEKGLRMLDKADELIDKMDDDNEKSAHKVVSLANRAWILTNDDDSQNAAKVIVDLENLWDKTTLEKQREKQAYIFAIGAFSLRRFAPKFHITAEDMYRKALAVYPNKSRWNHDMGRLVGQLGRIKGENLTNEEREFYNRALQFESDYTPARVSLIQSFLRTKEFSAAKQEVDKLDCKDNPSAIFTTARFYTMQRRYDEALRILKDAENLNHSEIFKQMGHVYKSMAYSERGEKRTAYFEKALECYDKCINLFPMGLYASLDKASLLRELGRNDEGERVFKELLEEEREFIPEQKVLLRSRYVEFLKKTSYGRETDIVKLSKEVITEATEKCVEINDKGKRYFTDSAKRCVRQAKGDLLGHYQRNKMWDDMIKVNAMLKPFGM